MSAEKGKPSPRSNRLGLEPVVNIEKIDFMLTAKQKRLLEIRRISDSAESEFSNDSLDRSLPIIIQESSSWSSSSSSIIFVPLVPTADLGSLQYNEKKSSFEEKNETIGDGISLKNSQGLQDKTTEQSFDINNEVKTKTVPRENRFLKKFNELKRKGLNSTPQLSTECSTIKADSVDSFGVTKSPKKKVIRPRVKKINSLNEHEEKETISKRLRVTTQLSTRCSKTSAPMDWVIDSDSRSTSSISDPAPPVPSAKISPLAKFGVLVNGNKQIFHILSKKQAHEKGYDVGLDKKETTKEKKVKKTEVKRMKKITTKPASKKKVPQAPTGKRNVGRPRKVPNEPQKISLKKLCSCTNTGCTENVCVNQDVWGVKRSLPKVADLTESTDDVPIFQVPLNGSQGNQAQISVRVNQVHQADGPAELSGNQMMSEVQSEQSPRKERKTCKVSDSKEQYGKPQIKKVETLSKHVVHLRRSLTRKISMNDERQEPDSTSFGIRTTNPSRSSLDIPRKKTCARKNDKDQPLSQAVKSWVAQPEIAALLASSLNQTEKIASECELPLENEENQSPYRSISEYSSRTFVEYNEPDKTSERSLPIGKKRLSKTSLKNELIKNEREETSQKSTHKLKSARFSPIIFNEPSVDKKVSIAGKKVRENDKETMNQEEMTGPQKKILGNESLAGVEVPIVPKRETRGGEKSPSLMNVAGPWKRRYEKEDSSPEPKKTKLDHRRRSKHRANSSSSGLSGTNDSHEVTPAIGSTSGSSLEPGKKQEINEVIAMWLNDGVEVPKLQNNEGNQNSQGCVESAFVNDDATESLKKFGELDSLSKDGKELSNENPSSSCLVAPSKASSNRSSSSSSSSTSSTTSRSSNKVTSGSKNSVHSQKSNSMNHMNLELSDGSLKETSDGENVADQDTINCQLEDDEISLFAETICDPSEEPELDHCFTKPGEVNERNGVQKNVESKFDFYTEGTAERRKLQSAPSVSSLNAYDIMNSQNMDHFKAQNNMEFLADYERCNDTTNESTSNYMSLFPPIRKVNNVAQTNFSRIPAAGHREWIHFPPEVRLKFNGYCHPMLRSSDCTQINHCRYNHKLKANDEFLHQEKPHVIKSTLQYAVIRGWYYYLSVVYDNSIQMLDATSIISIYTRLAEKLKEDQKLDDLPQFLRPVLRSLIAKNVDPRFIVSNMMGTFYTADPFPRRILIKGLIGHIPLGQMWQILRELVIPLPQVPIDIVPLILRECINFKPPEHHILEVHRNTILKMSQPELSCLNQNLLRKFSEMLPHIEKVELTPQASVIQGQGDGNDIVETSQEVASYASPDSSATVLNHQEPVRSSTIHERLGPRIAPNNVGEISTRGEWNLIPIDRRTRVKRTYSQLLWKFHLDLQSIREGLRHNDYNHVIRILNSLKNDRLGDFANGFYRILCKEIISAPQHLAEIIRLTVYSRKAVQILEILIEVGVFVLITLADIGARELACQLHKTLQPFAFGNKTSQVLLSAEILISTDRPLKALDLIKRYRLIYINRNKWTVKNTSRDEDLRRSVLQLLLRCLCLKHPDEAFNLFGIILKDQNCCYNPIDLTEHTDNLVFSLLEHKKGSLLEAMATTIQKHNLALNFSAIRPFISRLLHENEVLAKQLHRYATRLGVYPLIEVGTLTYITVNTCWTEEEMFLMMNELLYKLSNELEFIKKRRFYVYLRFEIMPTRKTLYGLLESDENSKTSAINAAKNKMKEVLARFDPIIKMIQLSQDNSCEVMRSTIMNYLMSQDVE